MSNMTKEEIIQETADRAAKQVAKQMESLQDKLIQRSLKKKFREEQKARLEITNMVKAFAEPEKLALAGLEDDFRAEIKKLRKAHEAAVQALKKEHNGKLLTTLREKDAAAEEIRETSRKKFKKAEEDLQKLTEKASARFEGFKRALESATLEDLQEMWESEADDDDDTQRVAKGGTRSEAVL